MSRTFPIPRHLLPLGISILLFGSVILLINNVSLAGKDTLSMAITADLVFTIPVIYFLLIRKTKVPKTTVISMMVAGLIIGTLALPKDSQTYLSLFKTWALPIIELTVFTIVVTKVAQVTRKYKSLKGNTPDFFTTLQNTCAEILPSKIVRPLVTEISVIYYGFFHWKKRKIATHEFTHHRKSGTALLLGVFIFLILIETFAVHLILARWNPIVAWVIFGLSAYTALQFFAFARSLPKRPFEVNNQSLILRYGILSETQIPLDKIEQIAISKERLEFKGLTRKLSPLGEIESHNFIITLKTPHTLTGLYGIKKQFEVLAFHVDEPAQFKTAIEEVLPTSQN